MSSGARNRAAPSGTSASKKSGSVDMSYLADKKLDKGKQKFVEETQEWSKPEKSTEREATRSEKRREDAGQKVKARGKHAPSPNSDFKKKVGGACALIFLSGIGFANFLATMWSAFSGNGIEILDVKDTAKVKEVLFGGDPWLIYCVNNASQFQKLPKVLDEEASTLTSSLGVKVGVLNCFEPTESGRSIADKYKWRANPPLNFVVANGDKPRTLGLEGVSDYAALEKKIKPALTIEAPAKIDTLKKWPEKCISRRTCIVVGHKTPAQKTIGLELLQPLQERHRSLRIVTLDTAFWSLKLGDAVLASRPGKDKNTPDILCLAKLEGGVDRGANDTHAGIFLSEQDSYGADAFMTQCQTQTDLVPVGVKPSISAKTAKKKKPTVIKAPGLDDKPAPAPVPKKAPTRKVDSVGSRDALDQDEALFEATDNGGEEDEEEEEEEEEDDDSEEVEL